MQTKRNANILLVDDRPEKLLAIETLLSDMPVQVVCAASGREALRHLLKGDFALILLDVNMPGMDGFETASLIRQRKSSEHIPIIFLTSYSDEVFMERGYSLGAVDYILQPVVPEVLRAKVSVFVELFQKSEELQRFGDLQRQRVTQFQKLTEASVAINSAASIQAILQVATDSARTLVGANQAVTLRILEETGGVDARTEYVASFSDKYASWRSRHLALHRCADVVRRSTVPARYTQDEFSKQPNALYFSPLPLPPIQGFLAAPLVDHNHLRIGVLLLSEKEGGEFTEEDEAIVVQLAQMTSIALVNAISFEARDANRVKDQFIAALSHELRTPLTPVLAMLSELHSKNRLPEDLREDLRMVWRNVELEARLIDDLLDLTRIRKSKVELHLARVDAHALIAEALGICESEIAAKEIVIRRHLRARKFQVRGDGARLHQVFWNLIKNAVKFTPPGGRIDIVSENAGDGEFVVQVKDSGIGITPDALPRIFNAFEQGERFITRQFGGLGLGLAISRALVDAHRGTIAATSEGRDKGATFTLMLPLDLSVHASAEQTSQVPPEAVVPRKSLKLLLVEDHIDTGRTMSRLLSMHHHEVTLATNTVDAIREFDRHLFDVVISDIGLPDGSGLELIRDLQARRSVRAIALSGFGMEEDLRRSREAGFHEHLTKPVDFPKLLDCIERISAGGDVPPEVMGAGCEQNQA